MRFILLLLAAITAHAQSEVRFSQRNPDTPYQIIIGYSGTNISYVCTANSIQPTSPSISITSATAASPIVFTVSGGHGFYVSTKNLPSVTISGGTGNWAAVNGTFTATIISSTTFSISTNGTGFGAVTGTLVFTTRAPRTTMPVWSVKSLGVDGSSNTDWMGWSTGTSAANQTCTGTPSAAQ